MKLVVVASVMVIIASLLTIVLYLYDTGRLWYAGKTINEGINSFTGQEELEETQKPDPVEPLPMTPDSTGFTVPGEKIGFR